MAGVELLFGPMLIGVFLNIILYGILAVQMFIYYQTYKRDASWIRYFVLYLFIVETLNTCFNIMMIYEPLITRYATPRATIIAPMMLKADGVVTVAISTPVQLFVAWRIKIISRSTLLVALICFFAICAFVGGLATTIAVSLIPEYHRFTEFQGAIITWLASSAIADVFITGSLVLSLYHLKTGSATDDIVNKIMRLTVQTGAITAFAAIADVTIFLILPHTTLNFIFDLPLSKLYTNSLMSTFNARGGWMTLTGPQAGHNVLFGSQKQSSVSVARVTDINVPHKGATDSYELQPHYPSTGRHPMKASRDLVFEVSQGDGGRSFG